MVSAMFGQRPSPPVGEDAESTKAKWIRLNVEADRLVASHAARRNALMGRASTLVGAAAIGASVSAGSGTLLRLPAAIAFLTVAILGLVVLWPRTGDGMNLGAIYDESPSMTSEQLELDLLRVKMSTLNEESLLRLAWVVRIGFVVMTTAILLLAIGAGMSAVQGGQMSKNDKPRQEPKPQTAPPRDPNPAFLQTEIKESGNKPTTPPTPRPTKRG